MNEKLKQAVDEAKALIAGNRGEVSSPREEAKDSKTVAEAVQTEEAKAAEVEQPATTPAREPETAPVEEPAQEMVAFKRPRNVKPRDQHTVNRYQNEVTLCGTIVKLVKTEKVAFMTVCTRATTTVSNFPTVMFFGAGAAKAAEFDVGQRVVVKGAIQSYDEKKLKPGQSPVLLHGLDVKLRKDAPVKAETPDDEMKPIEPSFCSDENKIELRGQILAIKHFNNTTTLTIRTSVNGRPSIVEYPYFARNTNMFLRNVYVHQYVRALGTVQTLNVPVEEDPAAEKPAKEVEKAATIRHGKHEAPRLKTKKKQYYVLYDIYAVDGDRR